MTSQIRGTNQAARNANDGISLAQTAEGDLAQIGNNLQRMRELAVQSANATNSTSDRAALDVEVQSLFAEIDRTANSSSFNGIPLLDGTFAAQDFQVGANATANDKITVASIADSTTTGLALTGITVATALDANAALGLVDTAISTVNTSRANLGALQNRFTSVVTSLQTSAENLSASRSRIQDADFAAETANLSRSQVLQQAGTAMVAQANQLPQGVLALLR
jgi:flagellin